MRCPHCNTRMNRTLALVGGEPDDPQEEMIWLCDKCGYEEPYLAEPFSFVDDEAQWE